MSKTISFDDFECLLLRLGFRPETTSGSQKLYEQPEAGAQIVLPPYQPGEDVRPHHWQHARWLLDAKGLLDSEAFDRMLEDVHAEKDCNSGG